METHVDETGSFEVFGSSYSFCDLGVVVSDLHLSDEWTSVTNVSSEPSFAPVVNEYREMCREVAAMQKSDLYHLRSLTAVTAPPGVVKLMGMICDELLGEKTAGDWNKMKDLIARSDFLGAVSNIDVRQINDSTLSKVNKVVNAPECHPDQISRPSTSQYKGAVTFAKWANKLYAEAMRIKAEM